MASSETRNPTDRPTAREAVPTSQGTSPPARRIDWSLLVYALMTAASLLMLFLALPGHEMWYLSFVALVPLFLILQHAPGKTAVLITWLAGYVFFYLSSSWLNQITPIGLPLLALYLSVSWLVLGVAVRVVSRGTPRLPFVVGVPLVWVAVEILRGPPMGGFCWHYLGHNLYRQLELIQVADLAGVYGVSFVVVTVNAALARILYLARMHECPARRRFLRASWTIVYAAVLVLGVIAYGRYRLAETEPVAGPRVSVVQGNIPQHIKEFAQDATWAQFLEKRRYIFDKYARLTDKLLDVEDDLVAWPETIFDPLEGERYGTVDYSVEARERARALRRKLGRPFLTGSTKWVHGIEHDRYYNAVYYLPEANGPFEVYLKIHLVPFGEYIPFREVGWIRRLVEFSMPQGYVSRLSAGNEVVLFQVKGWEFATPICYEDTTASLNRRFRKEGARFILNLTNDGWFGDTAELDQHLANSVFRTVENRFGMVRATNTGISAFVDPTGLITSVLMDEPSGRYREVEGVLTDTVWLDDRRTFYTQHGDVFAWLTVGWVVLFCLLRLCWWQVVLRRQK